MGTHILLGVLFLFIVFLVGIYNRLVRLRNRYKNAYSQIDVQLQRRYELIPNLVETAQGYMDHEKDTLEQVIQARNQASQINIDLSNNPTDSDLVQKLSQAEGALTQSLGKFFALAENYPDLKANTTMENLMEELTSTENKVSFARQGFNDSIMEYNNGIEQFPNNLIANNFGFKEAKLLELQDPEAKKAVKVSFS